MKGYIAIIFYIHLSCSLNKRNGCLAALKIDRWKLVIFSIFIIQSSCCCSKYTGTYFRTSADIDGGTFIYFILISCQNQSDISVGNIDCNRTSSIAYVLVFIQTVNVSLIVPCFIITILQFYIHRIDSHTSSNSRTICSCDVFHV